MLFLESPPQITSLSTKFMHEGGGVLQLDKYPFWYLVCWATCLCSRDNFKYHTYIHIHTYPPTIHIRTWQKSDFHWLFDSDFAPSALSLRLIFCATLLYLLWHHHSVTWPDPVIFYHKLRKVCPRGYWKSPYALLNDLGVIAKKTRDASPPLRVRWLKLPLSDVPRWVNNCIVFSLLY